MSGRAVYTIPNSRQWQYKLEARLPAILTGLFGIGLVICLFCIIPNHELADVRGARTQHSSGLVSSVTYLPVTRGNTNPAILASIDLAGKTIIFRSHANLHPNEPVQVTYRIGKSGNIHVDDIEPVAQNTPP